MQVVGPCHFVMRLKPTRLQEPIGHNGINLRLPTHGGLYAWGFEKDGPWEGRLRVQAVWKRPEIAVLSDSALGEFAL
jgi:hypothetical protein